ncbi:aldose 1-epimerase family protein [Candidatus Sumerlaeota bacterium]|nr:aldose 1-epimerase family protein [Candidatus Sumerlaeota bacterium]
MVKLFGKNWTRRELMRRVGNLDQIGGVRRVVLDDGSSKGVTALEFSTGSGLQFTVLADRGMDISSASYCGRSLCWRSSAGDVTPAFYDPAGLEWLHVFFGGLTTTCGLTYAGAPTTDQGEPLGLHGRYTSLPARELIIGGRWEGNRYVMSARGTMRETRLFGPNIVLRRTITTFLGESRLIVEDAIENEGWERQPLMLLYHCNFGFPLLDAGARVYAPSKKALARFSLEPVAEDMWSKFDRPAPRIGERVFYHDMKADRRGFVTVVLANEQFGGGQGFGAYLRYRQEELPRFVQWKMPGEGAYVMGLEPSNCWVDGRDAERKNRTLQFLRPGQRTVTRLEIGVLDSRRAIAQMRKSAGL